MFDLEPEVAASLIGAWSLDEGTGLVAADGSTFDHDGKLVNGPAWIEGVLGKALRFDGVDDRVEIAGFDPPDQGTLAFWTKPDALGKLQRLLGANDAFEVRLQADGRIGHDLAAGGSDVLTGATALKPGIWQHVALTWSRSSEVQEIYLDGRLDATKTGSADDNPGAAQTLSLGRRTGTTPYFKGALDEVLVFDRVLTAAEITDLASADVDGDDRVFPGESWVTRTPEAMGLDRAALDTFRQATGNQTGFIVKDGYQVYSWGTPAAQIEWASASKPVHSTMLLFALDEGKVASIDQSIGDFGWALRPDDAGITFRTLANMTSGYALPEGPDDAWAYNDYAIDLYVKTLYDRAFGSSANTAATAPDRLGALDFQDGAILDSTVSARAGYGLQTSARDFARIGWFWLNEGAWESGQLIPSAYFDAYWRAQVPDELQRTAGGLDDYLKVGTYGGGTDQTSYGPGSYGMNLWHNADSQLWPDAPADTYQANGHWNGEVLTVIPSRGLVAAWKGKAATPETFGPAMNDLLRQLSAAAGPLV